ncbi:MAG: CapA family protein [Oscillospiraceae bacterium]|nr:CapA family protein [Oscillospiraceae bacterium]
MAFDMDEMHRRRQEREQQRQQRAQQQRKMIFRLAVAGAVLIACGILIFVISRGDSGNGDLPSAAVTTVPSQTSGEQNQQTPGSLATVVHFAATGDLNITDKVVASGGMNYDYTKTFMDVLPLLAQADLTAVNLEGVLCGAPYGTATASAPQTLMTALTNAGVDLVQMANSYAIKNGVSGLRATLQNVRGAGLHPVGAFADKEEFEKTGGYTICNVRGVKIALVAFTKGMDGMALPAGSESCVNVLYSDYSSTYKQVNTQGITKVLRAAQKEKPDVTIALLHWGSEYNDNHSKTQQEIRKLMLAEGVDAIIGTHPHYVQEMEFDAGAGTFVAYSLGEFLGDASRAGTEYSAVLDLEITKDNATGETKITGYSYTPTFTVEEEDGTVRVVRLEAAMAAYEAGHIQRVSEQTYNKMVYALERVQDRVTPE